MLPAPAPGRNPDMKWRPLALATLRATQRGLLDDAARLLKPGYRLVYATCSVPARENEAVAEDFLASHPDFARLDAGALLRKRGIQIPDATNSRGDLRLWPHRHRTDGFYDAVLNAAPFREPHVVGRTRQEL